MSTQLEIYQEAIRHIGDARLATLTDDSESRYVLDDAWETCPLFVLRQAAWRFAQVTQNISGSGVGAINGYNYKFLHPAQWLRTAAIYYLSGSKECPVDVKEQGTAWYANASGLILRYVSSSSATNLAVWPEHFSKAVAVYLAYDVSDRITGDPNRKAALWTLFQQYLRNAMEHDADPENVWLPHQLDGSFLSAARNMLQQGFWNFALKTITPETSGDPFCNFTDSFIKPDDWLRTHAIFKLSGGVKELPIDCREQGPFWNANESIKVRYISSDYLDSTVWPEEFLRVVAAYLGIDWGDGNVSATTPDGQGGQKQVLWPQYLQRALAAISIPENPWLTFQLDGSYAVGVDQMLESGLWKFAIVTTALTSAGASTSPSYAYYFTKPTDWARTVRVYQQWGTPTSFPTQDCDIDFRDEGGKLHANVSPIILRYLSSTLGRNPQNWSDDFRQALLAYLVYQRAVADPNMSGAGLVARTAAYKEAEKNARIKDEMRERPKVNNLGVLRQSRVGGGAPYGRQQGWW